jgi:hypothetical protein
MYHCFAVGIHIYYHSNLSVVERCRDKHAPGSAIFSTDYPHTYGWAHRISAKHKTAIQA